MPALNPLQLILGILLAAVVAFGAYRLNSLDRSGAFAAFVLGGLVFGLGGLAWASVLLVFFVTSSGLSRLLKSRKVSAEKDFSKGSRRDAWQVAANGGVAGVAAVLGFIFPQSVYPWVLFAASFAAANADTWATELGVLSKKWPRSIITWQRVPPGTSGGISATGTLAALTGAMLIALTAWIAWPVGGTAREERLFFSLLIGVSGVIGSLVDSLLGGSVQGIYSCPVCQKETEKHPLHTCGTETLITRGWKWMNNDWVNLFCTISAALFALMLLIAGQ